MSTTTRQLWLLAGGNGAGKSTFYRTRLEDRGIQFVNADLIEKQLDPPESENPSYEAARIARWQFAELVDKEKSFCFETVFSHESKLDMMRKAKEFGYQITLVYLHLENASLNEARVKMRMSEGGHWVPSEKIAARITRSIGLMEQAVELADQFYLLDNSSHSNPFQQIVVKDKKGTRILVDPIPDWVAEILSL